MSVLLGFILRLFSGGIIDKVLASLKAHADSAVERERIGAAVAIEQVKAELARRQAQRDVLLAEQGSWLTRLMRPAFAYPLALYYGAVIADSLVFHSGSVLRLPDFIAEWSGWIISALFLADSGERITRTIMRKRG